MKQNMKAKEATVAFLNPRTCGIYKNGAPRYKTDPSTGQRTEEIDNELIEAVEAYLAGTESEGEATVPLSTVSQCMILAPTYFDPRYEVGIRNLLEDLGVSGVTLGELIDRGTISIRGGHGSPSNDQRTGHIPYVKVSDIRGLRINVNPTNLVSPSVARRFWKGDESNLEAWDLISPNRASSNIGEFAVLIPGEEQVVLTKEVFVIRVEDHSVFDPFYLLWALSLKAVREQWRRITLMQTNREDCGDRYKEIVIPDPPDQDWAREKSGAFRAYFQTIATAREGFNRTVAEDGFDYIASVLTGEVEESEED